jgi:hypothetical protein
MSMVDDYYTPAAKPAITPALALAQLLAVPLALAALPVFLLGSWPLQGWWIASLLWVGNRSLQWTTNRFIIGLPQTIAVGVAGVSFLTRAWGSMIVLLLTVHFSGKDVAVPAAILFLVLYTADLATRGLLYANSRRRPTETPL